MEILQSSQPIYPWTPCLIALSYSRSRTLCLSSTQVSPGLNRWTSRCDTTGNGVWESAKLTVPVTDYRCRGKYTFPFRLRHQLFHTDNPVSITGHRTCRAEEFAVDMVAARQRHDGSLVTRVEGATNSVRDYLIYGAEVHAIGDGVVTRVSNLFPTHCSTPSMRATPLERHRPSAENVSQDRALGVGWELRGHRSREWRIQSLLPPEGKLHRRPGRRTGFTRGK